MNERIENIKSVIVILIILTFALIGNAIWQSGLKPGWNFGPQFANLPNYLVFIATAISAGLLYLTLTQARVDTKIQAERNEINTLFMYLVERIDKFSFREENGKEIPGNKGIYALLNHINCSHREEFELFQDPEITQLISILSITKQLFVKLESSSILDKESFMLLTKHQFKYAVEPAISSVPEEQLKVHYCESCQKKHGLPDSILNLINEIKTYI